MTPETAANKYPSFCKLGEDGVLELYCDNHMLAGFRKCQGYFYEQMLSTPEGMLVPQGRAWSLEFGQYFHKCMEYFYQAQRDDWEGFFTPNGVSVKQDFIEFMRICSDLWKTYDLDFFMADEFKVTIGKNAHNLGGHDGALQLFTQYYKTHWRQERMRFVGWELSFGRGKEVPIITLDDWVDGVASQYFRAYYCGRIDLIIDNSEIIGPLDHKTTSYFDGREREHFKPHDGMQGYCYAVQQMLSDKLKEQGRICNHILINHVSIRPEKDMYARFKRTPISYTPAEMSAWLQRQRATFTALYNLLINDESPTWNTEICDMWYYSSKCPYKQLHEASPAYAEGLRKSFYQIKPAWSPYNAN